MILISTDTSISGGIRRYCLTLKSHFDIEQYILFGENSVDSGKLMKKYGKPPLYIFNFFQLANSLKNSKSNIVVLNDPQVTTITLFTIFINIFLKKKLFFISHGFLFHNNAQSLFKNLYFKIVSKVLFRFMTIVTVSKNDSNICEKFGVKNYHEILHGIKKVESKEKIYDFIAVGRNVPHKRLSDYVEFCNLIQKEHQDFSSILVTDERSLTKTSNPKIFSNLLDEDLELLLAQSKYALSFSTYEGFGLAMLEAVSAGAIPICYANDSFKSIFKDVPELLFYELEPQAAIKVVQGIESLSEDKYKHLTNRLEDIFKRYSVENMFAKYQNIFEIGKK